jgi:hypothetical protein
VFPQDLVGFLESGVSVLVGTRDARLAPDATRAVGARLADDGGELMVFLPAATCATALANVGDNGRIAVCFSRAFDHRAVQVKGRAIEVRLAREQERALVDRYRAALAEELGHVGVPPRATLRWAHWPCHVVRLRVEGVFVQTPGPGAGAPLEGGGGGAR